MSTKTTFKRIALVAVASLGFGMLSVAPSQAATDTATSVGANSIAPARATVQTAVNLSVAVATAGDDAKVGAKIVSGPTGSTGSAITFEDLPSTGPVAFAGSTTVSGTTGSTTASTTDTATAYTTLTTGSSTTGKLNLLFTPALAGTYQILVWANYTSYTAGAPSTTITITTAGTPTTATLTPFKSTFAASAAATATTSGLVKVDLKDAAGLTTVPNANESIDLSAAGAATATTVGIGGTAQSAGSKKSYSASSFKYGTLFVPVANTAAETIRLSANGSGMLSGNGLSSTISLVTKATPGSAGGVAADAVAAPSALVATAANTGGFTAATGNTSTNLTTQPLQFATTALTTTTAALSYGYRIIDTTGAVTGSRGATVSGVTTGAVADTVLYFSVAASLGTSGSYTVEPLYDSAGTEASSGTAIVVSGASGSTTAYSVGSVTPTVIQSAVGGTNTIKAKVTNVFGGAVASAAVVASVSSGRNALTQTGTNLVTDALGFVTYTFTDAGTATSSSTTDTVRFTISGSGTTTADATINYGAVAVSTVTVTGAASADVAPTVTYTNISTAAAGPHGSGVGITATVKDANGNLLAGVPVTFTLSGNAGTAIQKTATTDFTTVYTSSSGAATTYVIGWTNGTSTVTATAGGKTGTGKINFLSGSTAGNATASARVLSGTVSGSTLSYKVVDRFGNPVPGVTINLSRVGTGFFGTTSSSTASPVTDDNGTVDVSFSGSGTVTAKLASTYVQAFDLAGFVAETAVTAAVAGTTVGTGASFAPAGVNTVSLTVEAGSDATTVAATAAADAAAEATDAANAATDAANAAAEAADAATAAAQDAADAVAALATSVSEMVNALKKQITSLTNLVIKIQKKVRA